MNKVVIIGTVVIVAMIVAVFGYMRFVDSRLTPEELNEIRQEQYEQSKAEAEVQAEARPEQEEPKEPQSMEDLVAKYPDKKFVRIQTSKGDIVVELFAEETPITVANFVNLIQHKYYDGLAFHRVIPDFMIQGGCPLGTGTGGPGYSFEDEFVEELKFDRPGLLAMANSGPATNGSQFFITHVPTDWLNHKHTIFGEVLEGQEVVDSIAGGDTMTQLELAGDYSGLLESQKDHVAKWNEKLGS